MLKTSTTIKANVDILNFAVEKFHAALEKIKDVTNVTFAITLESIPVAIMEQSKARGGNALGLEPSEGPLVVILFYNSWDNASDDALMNEVNQKALNAIDEEAKRLEVFSPYRYLNYAYKSHDPIRAYGAESNKHLRAVGAKYDPEGFFQAIGAGPFKLPQDASLKA